MTASSTTSTQANGRDMHHQPLRVLIVDDSPALCQFLDRALASDSELDVVGFAHDAFEARDKIKQLQPDVLTLDVGMPKMDGLTFLGNLMRLRPMPVVVLSALTEGNDEIAEAARAKGAVEVVAKPQSPGTANHADFTRSIADHVKLAWRNHHGLAAGDTAPSLPLRKAGDLPHFERLNARVGGMRRAAPAVRRLIALGASTGGPEALRTVLSTLSAPGCALVLAQHMPARFMEPFARRLDSLSSFTIRIATDGEIINPGCGYVAPGARHLSVVREKDNLVCRLLDTAPVSGHRPSVDCLFASIAEAAGYAAIAALLTGMGNDGAKGLLSLSQQGALTIAQDEQSSVVWGMPGKAVILGGVDVQLAIDQIGPTISALLEG